MPSIHSLLVGIDRYAGGVPELAGCVNDVRAVAELLPTVLDDGVRWPAPLLLLDEQATRDAVVAGFRDHLSAAGPGDVALFWYAGHGAQQATAPELAAAEPDGLDETLLCHDSRGGASWDLADKELAGLVAEVSARGPHVLVVLDCCHSGSGVRAGGAAHYRVRRAPRDERRRPAASYLVRASGGTGAAGWDLGGGPGYVLLAACRADQTAKETLLEGQQRGAFSAALLAAVARTGGRVSYADLVTWTAARLRGTVPAQDPQLECPDPTDTRRGFLGGTLAAGGGYRMAHDGTGWFLDAGAVHGIPAPCGAETVLLSVRSATDPGRTGSGTDPGPVGTARVVEVAPHRSRVQPDGPLDPALVHRATVTAWPRPRIGVRLLGPAELLAPVRAALAVAGLAVDSEAGQVTVEATGRGYRVGGPGGGAALAHLVDGQAPEAVTAVTEAVQRIARWHRLLELTNPTSRLPRDGLRIEIGAHPPTDPAAPGPVRLRYSPAGRPPEITVRVLNTTEHVLFVAVLFLDEEYSVLNTLGAVGVERVGPGGAVHAAAGARMRVEIPERLHRQGVTELTDWITVIGCTEQFDTDQLLQSGVRGAALRTGAGVRTAGLGSAADEVEWQTAIRAVVVERPGVAGGIEEVSWSTG